MQKFLGILIILCAIGAVVSIVRGVIAMLQRDHERVNNDGVSESGLQQNRMMWRRIQFQAGAIVLVVILLLMARGHAG